MKVFDNKRLFLAIILVFTLVNMAFVITVVYKTNYYKNESRPYKHDRDQRKSGSFMAEEIGFDEQQLVLFNKSRKDFREKAAPLHKQLGELNRQLVNEVTSEKPDTIRCRQLSEQIGDVHTRFKLVSYNHFLEVRSISKPSQLDKLNSFYKKMLLDNNRYDRRRRDINHQDNDSSRKVR